MENGMGLPAQSYVVVCLHINLCYVSMAINHKLTTHDTFGNKIDN